jgi:hypothetical protein
MADPDAEKTGKGFSQLIELVKVLALPLVTLIVGYWFNTSLDERQQQENNTRLYVEMMGRREEADSNLRKDMFNSILNTFMTRDRALSPDQQIRQEILSLELLAFNFHESLDIGPLFKDVGRRIPIQATASTNPKEHEKNVTELRGRLETVAQEVIEHQLTVLSDSGMVERGNALPDGIKDMRSYVLFGAQTVPDPEVTPGEGVSRICLSMPTTDTQERHYRQFRVEILDFDASMREVLLRLQVSQLVSEAECRQPKLDLDGKGEVDTNFWTGLFDFPMIDNTRLSNGERCAVSLTVLNPAVMSLAVVYFPGSRASLKDKPYLDEVIRELVRNRQQSSAPASEGR